MKLHESTIAALKTYRARVLDQATEERKKAKGAALRASEHAANATRLEMQAEDMREILYRADPHNPDYRETVTAAAAHGSYAMLRAVDQAMALLAGAPLPEELDASASPWFELRFNVPTRAQADAIVTYIESTGGKWHNHSPRDEKHHWLSTTSYGRELTVEFHIGYTPDEPESDAVADAAGGAAEPDTGEVPA